MDAEQLRQLVDKGLRFEERIGEFVFHGVLPTRYKVQALQYEAYEASEQYTIAVYGRYKLRLVLATVRGWEGLRVQDLHPGAEDPTPLAYSADMAQLLFEERTDLLDELFRRVSQRVEAREQQLETDRGNSRSGQPGSEGMSTTAAT